MLENVEKYTLSGQDCKFLMKFFVNFISIEVLDFKPRGCKFEA